jgi:predicted nucleic-acid-binding protein
MRFIDTNIIIRYLTKDDPVKATACHRLMQAIASGQEQVETTESVIAEVVYILSSSKHYNLSHDDVVTNLAPVVQLRGLTVPRKRILLRSLALYKYGGPLCQDTETVGKTQNADSSPFLETSSAVAWARVPQYSAAGVW